MSRLRKTKRRIWTVKSGRMQRKSDLLATEEPLEIQLSASSSGQQNGRYQQRTIAITMRTPGNDYELAAGFLYSEGVIQQKDEITQMTYCVGEKREQQEYNLLNVGLNRSQLPELPHLERHFFTNSACGICGSTLLDDLHNRRLPPLDHDRAVTSTVLNSLPNTLRAKQILFESTGGLHAAALFDRVGKLITVREDVGRHNAVDKLVGWALLNKQLPLSDKIIMVSGRASYELLQKCVVAGAPIFCAVSAPSSLAVEIAAEFGVTLVGFLRDQRFNIYSKPERIALPVLETT